VSNAPMSNDQQPDESRLVSRATIAILACILFAMVLFQSPAQPLRDICVSAGLFAIVAIIGLESAARRRQREAEESVEETRQPAATHH